MKTVVQTRRSSTEVSRSCIWLPNLMRLLINKRITITCKSSIEVHPFSETKFSPTRLHVSNHEKRPSCSSNQICSWRGWPRNRTGQAEEKIGDLVNRRTTQGCMGENNSTRITFWVDNQGQPRQPTSCAWKERIKKALSDWRWCLGGTWCQGTVQAQDIAVASLPFGT